MTFRRLLREPLLHFLLIGLALFGLYGLVGGEDGDRRIVVGAGDIARIEAQYAALWGRKPNAATRAALIEAKVRDEVLYREGVAAGLGRDDPVIKRRIRQKLEVMAEEENSGAPPTEAELQAYLDRHAARFARPPVVSFEQLYFDPQGRATPASLAAIRAKLAAGAAPAGLGEATLLPARVSEAGTDAVARDFGADFAAAIVRLPVGQWAGPVGSGVGVHLVRVTALEPPRAPALAEVRPMVLREWENDRRIAAAEASYQRLRRQYDVEIAR